MNKFCFLFVSLFLLALSSCTVNRAKVNNDLKKYFDSALGGFVFV